MRYAWLAIPFDRRGVGRGVWAIAPLIAPAWLRAAAANDPGFNPLERA